MLKTKKIKSLDVGNKAMIAMIKAAEECNRAIKEFGKAMSVFKDVTKDKKTK